MKLSLLNPPPEVRSALDVVVSGLAAVRAQMSALQAAEAMLLHGGAVVAEAAAEAAQHEGLVSLTLRSGRSCGTREMAYRMVCSEIGAALHESDRTIASKVTRATTLITEYPAAYSALTEGKVSLGHANAIIDAGVIITDEQVRSKYEKQALEFAKVESVGRVRPVVKEMAECFADVSIEEHYEHANLGRNVSVVDGEDGMADLIAHIPAVLAHGIKDRVDQLAHHVVSGRSGGTCEGDSAGSDAAPKAPLDERTMDQLRADVFTDLPPHE